MYDFSSPSVAILQSSWSASSCGKTRDSRRHREPSACFTQNSSSLELTRDKQRSVNGAGEASSCNNHKHSSPSLLVSPIARSLVQRIHEVQHFSKPRGENELWLQSKRAARNWYFWYVYGTEFNMSVWQCNMSQLDILQCVQQNGAADKSMV